ncbi:MAG TPA: hypothetical protein VHH73_15210 [Verrucomicrobiae bacterium]|nr:hypothetical protein [Verrucomicrobiae bacterium]
MVFRVPTLKKSWNRRLVASVATALVGGIALARLFAPSVDDPLYKGRRLSSYLAQLPATYTTGDYGYASMPVYAPDINRMTAAQVAAWRMRDDAGRAEAEEAVLTLRERCFPFALTCLERRETRRERVVQAWLSRLRGKIYPSRTYARRWQAVTALRRLNRAQCDFSPWHPKLRELATSPDPDIRMAARLLLHQLDREEPKQLPSGGKP